MENTETVRKQETEFVALGTPANVLDNLIRVTTPENISFQYQIVGPFRRVIAYGLDLLFIGIFLLLLFLVSSLLFSLIVIPLASYFGVASLAEEIGGVLVGFWFAIIFAVGWFYGAIFETYFNGQSLGKMVVGLRVLAVDGHSINGAQAALAISFACSIYARLYQQES